jgi:hypothetical protein
VQLSQMNSKYDLLSFFLGIHHIQGVPELTPQGKREYLGKSDNFNGKEKKVLSQAIIEKRHPKLDQSELSTIEVR